MRHKWSIVISYNTMRGIYTSTTPSWYYNYVSEAEQNLSRSSAFVVSLIIGGPILNKNTISSYEEKMVSNDHEKAFIQVWRSTFLSATGAAPGNMHSQALYPMYSFSHRLIATAKQLWRMMNFCFLN